MYLRLRMAMVFGLLWPLVTAVAGTREPAPKTETVWLKLSSSFRYQVGKTEACRTKFWRGNAYFAAELREGRAVQAAFRSWKYPAGREEIRFDSDELGGLKFERDTLGRYWLKQLKLTPRLLSWSFFYFNPFMKPCRPDALATIWPGTQILDFELDGLPYGIFVSYSTSTTYEGRRTDRQTYRVENFTLVQMMLDPSEVRTIRDFGRIRYSSGALLPQ
jgi:hypothetical protein